MYLYCVFYEIFSIPFFQSGMSQFWLVLSVSLANVNNRGQRIDLLNTISRFGEAFEWINKFIDLLHGKNISTFLVTNAQFPDAIKALKPVTQLYVSVDAGNKENLKKIDRPLFRDFWQRYLDSLKALGEKQQRTVYRLTLVKGWNVEEIKGYADLINLGRPDFIEIKGVTYCGDSKASTLTMENVPWYFIFFYFLFIYLNLQFNFKTRV